MSKFGDMILRKILPSSAPWLAGAAVLVLMAGTGHALASASAGPERASLAQARYVQVAGLFGDDEEEKAAQQREQAQDSGLANLTQRVSDLEESLRRLTGQVEEANHRADVLQQRMIRMQKDFDYKLCTLSAQQLGASADGGDQNALPCNPAAQAAPSGSLAAATAGGETVHLAPPPGVLGTLPAGTPMPKVPPGAATTASVGATGGGSRAQFDAAMNLLAKAQYDEARSAFRGFADAYPKDDLAPQAVYWVGDIAYVQKDYPGAARAFAEEIKKYPTSPRAPESMLKLGQSLIAMNQKQEGCTTLGALSGKYPKASKTVLSQALDARKAAGCR